MQIIPVLDLKAGQAVHAVRGERADYAPVEGVLGSGTNPVRLALAYRDQLGCRTCYVADLDAIANRPVHTQILRALIAETLALWVDAGVSSLTEVLNLASLDVTKIIIGSETLLSADQLTTLATQYPPRKLILSVDLQNGALRAPAGIDTPQELVSLAAQAGIQDVILLDLARVGATVGPPLDLLIALQPHFPNVCFYAGGGVRYHADLEALAQAGAAGALIATAFHQGALTAADLKGYEI